MDASSSSAVASVVVMGVSGSGKTTVGRALAEALGRPFLDADDFHSPASREKMHAGHALDDADRAPWLLALSAELRARRARGEPVVLACSALRRSYRDALRAGLPPGEPRFVFLAVEAGTVQARVGQRAGHFFPTSLVANQMHTLEPPTDAATAHEDRSDDALFVPAGGPLADTLAMALAALQRAEETAASRRPA